MQILLTTTPTDTPEGTRPQLRLAIYPREVELARKIYRWPADPEMATGARCAADSCEVAPAGEVQLTRELPDSSLEGTVTLHFAANETIAGSFRAVWQSRRVFCG